MGHRCTKVIKINTNILMEKDGKDVKF